MTSRIVVACLAVALVMIAVAGLEGVGETLVAQVVVGVAFGLALIVGGVVFRPEARIPVLCDPFVIQCAFQSQFFVVGPLAMVAGGYDLSKLAFAFSFGPDAVLKVLAAFALMMATIIIGYRSRFGPWVAEHLPDFRTGPVKLPGLWGERVLVAGSVIGCLAYIEYQGGILEKLATGYGQDRAGGAMFRIAFEVLLSATLLMGWRVLNDVHRRRSTRIAFAGLLFFDVAFYGIVAGIRKYVFFVFFGLAFLWIIRNGFRRVPKLALGSALVVLMLYFAFWGTVRARPITQMLGLESTGSVYAEPTSIRAGYLLSVADPFNVACVAWEVFPAMEPHRHGQTLMVTLLGFIPRAVWPDKPVGIGKEITRYFVGPFYEHDRGLSFAVTLLGDFYINFGWMGVVIGGLLLGIACRLAAHYAVIGMVGGRQLIAARAVLPAVFIMGLGEVRADMAGMLMFYILTMIPLVGVFTLCRFEDGRLEEAPA